MMRNNDNVSSGIYKTKDGGITWLPEKGIMEKLTPLAGFKTIYVAGARGLINKTDRAKAPNIPGYIYGAAVNCENTSTNFITGPLPGLNFVWSLSGGGTQKFKNNLDTVSWNSPGTYSLTVTTSNVCGTSPSRSITVTVNESTVMRTAPAPETVCAGAPATFSVTATGTDLKYQWKKSGLDIAGAINPTYIIDSATAAHAGDYSVTVTGLCGSVNSAPVKLNLLPSNSCTTGLPVVNELVQSFHLLPNAVTSNTVIQLTMKKAARVHFKVVDVNGKVVDQFNRQAVQGENLFPLSFAYLRPGMYQLTATAAGLPLPVLRFVKL
jgi:hypothetical protein